MTNVRLVTASTVALEQLKAHLSQWFYQPDLEALEVTLSVAASHYTIADPIWLFVVGPPATGKTSANIQSITLADKAYVMGDLTPQTFLSGKKKTSDSSRDPSLLTRLGNPLFLMKDFTTIMSKRPDDRLMIIAQLREIYDGTFTKDTGETGRLVWNGKCTMIAATTPAIEREWMILRDLGERFMTVRWRRENGLHSGSVAYHQRGKEKTIGTRTAQLGAEILRNLPTTRPDLPDSMLSRIIALGEVVALVRNRVVRDSHGARDIIDLPPAEGSSRIVKALAGIVVNYAGIHHREVETEDIRLAKRMALNSMPSTRFRILSAVPATTSISGADLAQMSDLPHSSLEWQLDELQALRLIKRVSTGNSVTWEMTQDFREVWLQAFPDQ